MCGEHKQKIRAAVLSLYGLYGLNHIIPIQPISDFWDLVRTISDPWRNEIVSVVALCIAQKRTLRKLLFCQRSPSCAVVSLQSMDFADLDLSRSHFVTARGLIASHWNEMRSEEV